MAQNLSLVYWPLSAYRYTPSPSIGWVSIPWLFPAEVSSLSMRTKGAALATAMDWLLNYVVVQTTSIGMHYLHWGL